MDNSWIHLSKIVFTCKNHCLNYIKKPFLKKLITFIDNGPILISTITSPFFSFACKSSLDKDFLFIKNSNLVFFM